MIVQCGTVETDTIITYINGSLLNWSNCSVLRHKTSKALPSRPISSMIILRLVNDCRLANCPKRQSWALGSILFLEMFRDSLVSRNWLRNTPSWVIPCCWIRFWFRNRVSSWMLWWDIKALKKIEADLSFRRLLYHIKILWKVKFHFL